MMQERNFKFTLTHDSKDFPYLDSKASLMSPKSISDRDTMMRMRVLSLVPARGEKNFFNNFRTFRMKFQAQRNCIANKPNPAMES